MSTVINAAHISRSRCVQGHEISLGDFDLSVERTPLRAVCLREVTEGLLPQAALGTRRKGSWSLCLRRRELRFLP